MSSRCFPESLHHSGSWFAFSRLDLVSSLTNIAQTPWILRIHRLFEVFPLGIPQFDNIVTG